MRTYDGIRKAVLAKGYKFYTEELKLNFIWERTDDIITNKFTDLLHVVYIENNISKVISIPATTKPGLKGSIDSPITYQGVTGTAIIVPGQYVNAWTFMDTFKGFSSYPYFRQYGKVDYWRDYNKDKNIDRVQFQDDKIFGTHWHKMSNVGTYGSGLVNNWSLGCMGAAEPQFKQILPIVREAVALHGSTFTGTIMESVDFSGSAGTVTNRVAAPQVNTTKSAKSYSFKALSAIVVVTARGGLSLRKGAPNTVVSKIKTYPYNSALKVVGYVTNGQTVNGNSKWYRDTAGNYFWGGGVAIKSSSAIKKAIPKRVVKTSNSKPTASKVIGEVICVTQGLRLRKTPDLKYNYVGAVEKGTVLKYVSIIPNGQSVSGNSKWYKGETGLYFWSGGVQ